MCSSSENFCSSSLVGLLKREWGKYLSLCPLICTHSSSFKLLKTSPVMSVSSNVGALTWTGIGPTTGTPTFYIILFFVPTLFLLLILSDQLIFLKYMVILSIPVPLGSIFLFNTVNLPQIFLSVLILLYLRFSTVDNLISCPLWLPHNSFYHSSDSSHTTFCQFSISSNRAFCYSTSFGLSCMFFQPFRHRLENFQHKHLTDIHFHLLPVITKPFYNISILWV